MLSDDYSTYLAENVTDIRVAINLQKLHDHDIASIKDTQNRVLMSQQQAHDKTVALLESKLRLSQYKLASLSCRSLVEALASYNRQIHPNAACSEKVPDTTKGVLAHLSTCKGIPIDLYKQLVKFEGLGPAFPPKLAHSLFGDLSEEVHRYMMIEKDTLFIPADLSKEQRHLLVALAAWKCLDYVFIDMSGADVTANDQEIRKAFLAMSPKSSAATSMDSLVSE